jgi:hypothetical protein
MELYKTSHISTLRCKLFLPWKLFLFLSDLFPLEEFYSLEYNTVQSIESQALLATCLMLVSCVAYSSTLKMEVTCCFKTLADFQQTTQQYIPENRNLRNHCCENLKYYSLPFFPADIQFILFSLRLLHFIYRNYFYGFSVSLLQFSN